MRHASAPQGGGAPGGWPRDLRGVVQGRPREFGPSGCSRMSKAVSDPDSGLPIGEVVAGGAARQPERTVLSGRMIRLEPLDAQRHSASLWRETHDGARANRWQYLWEAPFADAAAFRAHLERMQASDDPLCFAVVDLASLDAVGYMTLMRVEPVHRCIEVGNILFGTSLSQSTGATEAQYLLMRYAFENLHFRRYEWKCNALNEPSRRAALRLGFRFEGVFRQHMIIRGRNRDTAWYSVIDSEWPRLRDMFEHWLESSNFDAAGRQRRSLESFR